MSTSPRLPYYVTALYQVWHMGSLIARVPLHNAGRLALCTTYYIANARSTWTPTKYQLFAHVWMMLLAQVFHLTTNYFSEGEVTPRRMDAALSRRLPSP